MTTPQFKSMLRDTGVVSAIRDEIARVPSYYLPDLKPRRRQLDRLLQPKHVIVDSSIFGERVPEKVVLEKGRPALLVTHDTFEEPGLGIWKERLECVRGQLERAIPAVGRVELRNHPTFEWNGTAWMIGESTMVTNRHVALLFAERRDGRFTFRRNALLKEIRAEVDLKEEHGVPDEVELCVTEILHIEDDQSDRPDLAFLRVEGKGALPTAIPLSTQPLHSQDLIAVIGYPSFDPDELPSIAREIFNGIYAVKRLSPGMVIDSAESDGMSFSHDCTTLGGNSGSVVLSLVTGEAVGIHYAGVSRQKNYAISGKLVGELFQRHVAKA